MVLVDLTTGAVVDDPDAVATVLEPTADEDALASAAGGNAGPIAILFPSFTDGRGFSLARLLRERHGFAGEVRAVGYLIPDHGQFLLRSGFDTAEIADPEEAETWKASLERIRHNYQPAVRNSLPLRWNASHKAAVELDTLLGRTDDIVSRVREVGSHIEGRIAFSTSLGLEDQVILHAIAKSGIVQSGAEVDVFTLDTGRLFPEVLETVELSELRYRIRIRLVAPDAQEVEELVARDGVYGFRQSVENRKSCCEIRKVRPLNRALDGAQGWITGLRRDHSEARADVPLAEWDADRGLIKVNPLADWSTDTLAAYIAANNIPVNPLHARGFVSIGCAPCTRAVRPGEDPRSGRWWWESEEKKECGLHVAETATQKEETASQKEEAA
ncbi:MAG: phosphoadenylyl-sulfate reductase [Methyloligellaceae bacterium]